MNKRIPTLFLCLVMVVAMLVSAVPVSAEPSVYPAITFTIKPDKTTAKPGDTIAYQAILGPVEKLQSVQFELVIPEELEFIDGSCPAGLADKLGADTAKFAPSTKVYGSYGDGEYTSTGDTVLVNFTCKVKAGVAAGKKPVISIKDQVFADPDEGDYELHFDANSSAVTVAAAPKPATGITLNKTALSLAAGGSEQLNATVQPADTTDTVKWSSNKPDIAKVDSTGKVTAVAAGEAVITAKAGDKTATCTVKVSCSHSLTPVAEKASNCTEKGWDAYKKCDLCGKLFNVDGDPISEIPYRALNNDHDFNTAEWGYKGADGHAHTCSRNAAHRDDVQPHTPDHAGGATYEYAVKCSVCQYEIEPQLEAGDVRIEVPFKLTVKKTGEMDPGKETFKFVLGRFGATTEYTVVQDTVETEGEKTYDGKFVFTVKADRIHNLSEGFVIRQVKGNAEGWTYDETAYYVMPDFTDNGSASWTFFGIKEDERVDMEKPMEEIGFTNSYNAKKPVTPPAPQKPESPKTGNGSMIGLLFALLFVSGAAMTGIVMYSRKKKAADR